MNRMKLFLSIGFQFWMSVLCFGQDSINKPSICLSLGAESISMRHSFEGTVHQRFRTPIGFTPKASLYLRSTKGQSVKVDIGLLQYLHPFDFIDDYPTTEAYGHDPRDLAEDMSFLAFLNSNVLVGKRYDIAFARKDKRFVFPIDVYAGLNFQIPFFKDDGNFYKTLAERDGPNEGDVYREIRTVRGLLPRLSVQVMKEFKLSGNVNWYLGCNWVQGFTSFLQKDWWIDDAQGNETERLSMRHTGSYLGFEIGLRGML